MNQSNDSLTRWTFGSASYVIERYLPDPTGTLRAWDTADEYLLTEALRTAPDAERWLVINDDFGALTTAVCGFVSESADNGNRVDVVQDTSIGREAITRNLGRNHQQADAERVHLYDSLSDLELDSAVDIVLLKAPKSLAALEQQLLHLRRGVVNEKTRILVAGMVKHLSPRTQSSVESIFTNVERHLAVRKARLFSAPGSLKDTQPADRTARKQSIPELNLTIEVSAGVFANEKPDPATLFLCAHIPALPEVKTIMDLGCGSGLLGIVAGRQYTGAKLIFTDTSTAAIRCAEHNVYKTGIRTAGDGTIFLGQHRLEPWSHDAPDLMLCNPPFHHKHTQTLGIARAMFNGAERILQTGGRLLVVANRHLNYHDDLRRIFGNVSLVAENSRFRIYQSLKS
ncbi:MAG: methyltransferase [Gammaproteobacteria bacterium]|nr:methyltransferase [Gammaproteobacteria bacterium]